MSSVEGLREFVSGRLAAAAEEILGVFKQTLVEYEEEIDRQRRLLDIVWKPEIKLHRIELPQQNVCKEEEEEVLADQQLCVQERNSSLDQEDPEPPQIKEEQQEVCTSQEGEQLELKQETDVILWTPADEESDHSEEQTLNLNSDKTIIAAEKESVVIIPVYVVSEPNNDQQLLSHNSQVAESQDQKGGEPADSGSTRKPHTCKNSRESFSDISEFNGYITIHTGKEPFTCKTCGKAFRLNNALTVHMRRAHTGEKSKNLCKTCGKGYSNSTKLKRHMLIHTGEKSYVCKTCGKGYSDHTKLKRHMTIHTGEKPYLCKTCGARCRDPATLNNHLRSHTGAKPYTCKICGKRFSASPTLKAHLRIHTGEKPWTCKICGRHFRRNSNLTSHMRTHTGEKPYLCKTCGKGFSESTGLKCHMRIHTGEKPYTCEICGRTFRQSGNLTGHIKKAHTAEEP